MKRSATKLVFLSGITLATFACSSSNSPTGTGGHAGGGNAGSSGHGGSAAGSGGAAGATAGTGGSGGVATGSGGHAGTSGGAGSGGDAGAMSCVGAAGAAGHAGAAGGSAGAAGGSAGGAAGGIAGATGIGGAAGALAGAGGAGGAADPVVTRGDYLVNKVLGCPGCHTPPTVPGGNTPDMTRFLAGKDCFVKNGCDCLSSANLTNDDTGLKKLTDQQVKDAFTKGKDPDQAGAYLFATMPYYQFSVLSDDDANAIVKYLRSVPAVHNEPADNTGIYATQPTAPQNAGVALADLPNGTGASAVNGKYMAALTCVTCHTVDATVAAGMPKHIDATKAFQGGKVVTATGTPPQMVQTSNLTPDATGIMGWTPMDVLTAIKTVKDKMAKTICGMRAIGGMTDADATDIGTYLTTIPAVANNITMVCM